MFHMHNSRRHQWGFQFPTLFTSSGFGEYEESNFWFLEVLGNKFSFSSGFLGVLRKEYFHDFGHMRGKIGYKGQMDLWIC